MGTTTNEILKQPEDPKSIFWQVRSISRPFLAILFEPSPGHEAIGDCDIGVVS